MPPVGGFVALAVGGGSSTPRRPTKAAILAHFTKIDFVPNSDFLKGKIVMHFDPYRISHEGIKVRLEGDIDGVVIDEVETVLEGVDLVHGQNRLKFHLTFPPHRSFPIPFVSQQGSLTYRIYGFIKREDTWEKLDEKLVKFKGYYNVQHLGPNPFTETKQMSIKSGEVKSTFRVPNTVAIMGQCNGLQGVLELNGVLEKSQVEATLTFLRNTSYEGDTLTDIIVSQTQHAEICQNNAEFKWAIDVPMMKQISYSNRLYSRLYSVRYYLKYEVLLGVGGEQYAGANGVVEVQIGTKCYSNTNKTNVKTNGARHQQPTTSTPSTRISQTNRRGSTLSNTNEATTSGMPQTNRHGSIMSLVSLLSLPPAYSQLSSRFGSMMSLETLPPRYDDLQKEE